MFLYKIFSGAMFLLILLGSFNSLAVTEFDRSIYYRKPGPISPFKARRPPILPGTAAKKKCVALGTTRCLDDRPERPFYQRYHNRMDEANQDHPRALRQHRYQPRQNF